MDLQGRFRKGIYMAAQSFTMLYAYPKLLIYLGFAAIIYFLAQVLVYNMPLIGFVGDEITIFIGMQGVQYSLIEFTQWLYQGFFLIVTFVYGFVVTFLHVCLIRHTLAIIYEDAERAHVRVVLSNSWAALGRIAAWSILFTLMSFLLRIIAIATYSNKITYPLGVLVVIVGVGAWLLLTFFVLPIIAVHNVTIWKAIKISCKMVRALIAEILGAECWICVISLIIFIPLSIILRVLGQGAGGVSLIGSLIGTLIAVFAGYIILSAQTVLRTKLYYYYVQPIEEIAFLNYPHF